MWSDAAGMSGRERRERNGILVKQVARAVAEAGEARGESERKRREKGKRRGRRGREREQWKSFSLGGRR